MKRCRGAACLSGTGLVAMVMVMVMCGATSAQAAGGRLEVPGNPSNLPSQSFKNYETITGRGPDLTDHQAVLISCRVRGKAVADGDVWWYRIAAKPWKDKYYVSADDFYNDGRSTGSLKGTPYFDPKVPLC